MITSAVDIFTDATTGLIPQLVTGATDILTGVLPFMAGIALVYFGVRWVLRKGLKG